MNDSNDDFSELFEDDAGKQSSTSKLVELRKKCQEIDSLILELCEKLERLEFWKVSNMFYNDL